MRVPEPFTYIQIGGLPAWTNRRMAVIGPSIDALEKLIPLPLVYQAVENCVRLTLDHVFTSSPADTLFDRIREILQGPRAAARIVGNAIRTRNGGTPNFLQMNIDLAEAPQLWEGFITVEAEHARKQIVRLWLDMLTYARATAEPHHGVHLDEFTLLPVDRMLTWSDRLQSENNIAEIFVDLLLENCCVLQSDLEGLLVGFFQGIEKTLQENGFLPLQLFEDEYGRTLSIQPGIIGGYTIPSIPEHERYAWSEHHRSPLLAKMPPHVWVIAQLVKLNDEIGNILSTYGRLGAPWIKPKRDLATMLVDQLRCTQVPETARRSITHILKITFALLLKKYEFTLEETLEQIFPGTRPT